MPNYLLHESAHAVSYAALFPADSTVSEALSDPQNLTRIMLCESYAMTAEYLAACSVGGAPDAWLFSISSYRHRTQKKKAIGELIDELGLDLVTHSLLLAFLCGNFLIDQLDGRRTARIIELSGHELEPRAQKKLRGALNGAMQMSAEFREHTARLFLTMYGYPRNVKRVLARDPFADQDLKALTLPLVRLLAGD